MARQARMLSKTSIYHIMIRGSERQSIFIDEEDKIRFIDTLQTKLKISESKLFAYCLMDNHVHLLIGEGKEDIAKIMKRINVSYALYFNRKYKRIGHLFQDRFKSEVIENDNYISEAVRYIHNNPVKASMVKAISDYRWSSYKNYLSDSKEFIVKETVLNMFSENREKAVILFKEFSEKNSDIKFVEYNEMDEEEKRLKEETKAKEIIKESLSRKNIFNDNYMENKQIRNEIILELREKGGFSIRRIAELLKINRGVVQKVVKEECDN